VNAANNESPIMKTFRSLLRAFAAAALLAFGAGAHAFNPEVRISNIAGPSINPAIAAVGSNVYVVWVENFLSGGVYYGDIMFSRSIDNGVSFSTPVNLTSTPTRNDIVPMIAAGGTQVHVYWTDSGSVGQLYSRASVDSGVSFAPEANQENVPGFYSVPQGALVDTAGNVHLAFYSNRPPANNYGQVYYRCSSNQGTSYSAAVNITGFDGIVDNEAPRFAQATDGTLYLLMRSTRAGLPQGGFPPFEHFLMRTDAPVTTCAGVNWLHPPQKLTKGLPEEFANSYGGNITAGAGNVLHAAWWSDKIGTNLYYRRGFPNGKGFEAPVDISGHGPNHLEWDGTVPGHTSFGLVEDASAKLHVVFGENNHLRDGFQSGSLYYRCSNDGGVTWNPRINVNSNPETSQPRGAYANNRFHMVWMDWRDNNTGAEIYYRSATTGACASAVASNPTELTDLNGDGKSDLLYRNFSTGQVYRILMNGTTVAGAAMAYTEPNTQWSVVADADFNGDGIADLLWRNSATGQVFMQPFAANGLPTAGTVFYTEPNANWKIVHTPDLDGDGRADLLWWNQSTGQLFAMLMNGSTVVAQGMVYTEPNTAWKVVAVGDFAGSGKKNQLVYRNSTTGQVYLMTVNFSAGVFSQSGVVIYTEPNTAWKILAAADYNGDGKSDLLWRNDSTGQLYIMLMNGGAIASSNVVYTEPNLAWKIVSEGDYNGDGKADLLYRNDVTGQVFMILMNGLATAGQAMVYSEPNLQWHLLGPYEYAQ
jgi:hypothetical protein